MEISEHPEFYLLRLKSEDGTNRLTRRRVAEITKVVENLREKPPTRPLIITGNSKFFSAGADLNEVAALSGAEAYEFALLGQRLMRAVDDFPAPVIAAISGYCMGGGLDLALTCDMRMASRNAIFGHRGAALGIMTGWGGTQRLRNLVGRAQAIEIFITAKKLHAGEALRIGLIDSISDDPLQMAITKLTAGAKASATSL